MAVSVVATGAGTYAGSAEVSIVLSASPVENDVIVAFIGAQTTATLALDTEWVNALGGTTVIQPSDAIMATAVVYHVVTAAEDAANQTTWLIDNLWSGGETGEWAAVALRGVDLAGPIAASATGSDPNAPNPFVLPAVASGSVANTGDLVVRGVVKDATGTYTNPAGHTQRATSNTAQGIWLGTRDAATTAGVEVAATNITVSAGDEYCAATLIIKAASAGGTTPVSNTIAISWQVSQSVTSTHSNNWAVRQTVGVASAISWNIFNSVHATVDTVWTVSQRVVQTIAESWSVGQIVARTLETSWSTVQQIIESRVSNWSVLSTMSPKILATSWEILGTVTNEAAITWSAQSTVLGTVNVTWNTEFDGDVIQQVSTGWAVAGWLTSANIQSWNQNSVLEPKAVGTTWAVQSIVSTSLLTGWGVGGTVSTFTGQVWNTRAIVSRTANILWSITGQVIQTGSTNWNVNGWIVSEAITGWGVGGVVVKEVLSAWGILHALTTSLVSGWAVRAVTSTVITSEWNTLALITTTTIQTWATRRIVVNLVDQDWSIYTPVQSVIVVEWMVYRLVVALLSSQWETNENNKWYYWDGVQLVPLYLAGVWNGETVVTL
jgi:hypothetical protein